MLLPTTGMVPMGPIAICRSCKFPRSVTIMGKNRKCGHCLLEDYTPKEDRKKCIKSRVAKTDDETTSETWVECHVRTYRAQYVVYVPETLNVKPKCHYCREGDKAPTLECTGCSNRTIYPEDYRPKDVSNFRCYACSIGRKSVIDVETTASKLSVENTTAWLLRNDDKKIAELFIQRSLYHTITAGWLNQFTEKVEVFPLVGQSGLVLRGKPVQNMEALVSEFRIPVPLPSPQVYVRDKTYNPFRHALFQVQPAMLIRLAPTGTVPSASAISERLTFPSHAGDLAVSSVSAWTV